MRIFHLKQISFKFIYVAVTNLADCFYVCPSIFFLHFCIVCGRREVHECGNIEKSSRPHTKWLTNLWGPYPKHHFLCQTLKTMTYNHHPCYYKSTRQISTVNVDDKIIIFFLSTVLIRWLILSSRRLLSRYAFQAHSWKGLMEVSYFDPTQHVGDDDWKEFDRPMQIEHDLKKKKKKNLNLL